MLHSHARGKVQHMGLVTGPSCISVYFVLQEDNEAIFWIILFSSPARRMSMFCHGPSGLNVTDVLCLDLTKVIQTLCIRTRRLGHRPDVLKGSLGYLARLDKMG